MLSVSQGLLQRTPESTALYVFASINNSMLPWKCAVQVGHFHSLRTAAEICLMRLCGLVDWRTAGFTWEWEDKWAAWKEDRVRDVLSFWEEKTTHASSLCLLLRVFACVCTHHNTSLHLPFSLRGIHQNKHFSERHQLGFVTIISTTRSFTFDI